MLNSISLTVDTDNGDTFEATILGEHKSAKGYGLEFADVYSIWAEDEELLGSFTFSAGKTSWEYDGGDLTPYEQQQIADFIRDYKESDWEP